MKSIFSFLFWVIFSLDYQVFAQMDVLTCGLNPSIEASEIMATIGGKYKPSSNAPGEYFRALYVFAQFASDTKDVPGWPKNNLPSWAYSFVNDEVSENYSQFTISEYFDVMSEDDFDFIGDIHPQIITVQLNKSWDQANIDVINQLNNQIENFRRYDNWYFSNGAFHFSESNGDGYFDMIHIIYRWADKSWFSYGENWGGIAYLGFAGYITTHDGIKISGAVLNSIGSGITTNNKGSGQSGWGFAGHIAHEYGHYLLGGGHPRVSGVMADGLGGNTFAMSALEREALGYIPFESIYNGQAKTIGDYLTEGDALKVTISETEYFIIENHRRLNHNDQIIRGGAIQGALDPTTSIGKGIYVWYVKGNSYPWTIFALTADGSWKWKFERWETMVGWGGPGNPDPVVAVLDRNGTYKYLPNAILNQTGLCDRNSDLYVNVNGSYQHWARWHDIDIETQQWYISRDCLGDETDPFKIGYNDQITPWSNPSTTKFVNGNENPTNITIQLLSEDQQNNQATIRVYSTQAGGLTLPPSKPQNLKVTVNTQGKSVLTWEKNIEPDIITNGKYKIYRAETCSQGEVPVYELIATIDAYSHGQPITTYTDNGAWNSADCKLHYKITAYDNTNKESIASDPVWRYGQLRKEREFVANETVDYKLYSNYPNPFNPSTSIEFDLKEKGHAILSVYDIIGREVVALVNEIKESGQYSIHFDASNLPSGVYIYTLRVNNFMASKKMLLIK